eukprot:jgi/Psemu1/17820/gm1.17820_g
MVPPVLPLLDSPTRINTPRDYFPGIAYIGFSFLPHPAYAGIENLMNPVYGLNITFTNILLADSSNLHDSDTTPQEYLLLHPHCTIQQQQSNSIFIGMNTTPINVHNFAHFGQTSFPKPTAIPQAVPTILSPAAAANTTTTTNALNQQCVAIFNQQTNILQQQSKMLTNLNQSKTSPQTLHPYIPMKFNTLANNRYTFNHTHCRTHTPAQLTLLHSANITPSRQMRYVIDNASYPASSFLTHNGTYFVFTNLGASSKEDFCSTINQCKDTTPYAFYEWYKNFWRTVHNTENTATHTHHALTQNALTHVDSPSATLTPTISLPHS